MNRAEYASERARLLFGQYRRGEANDPDVYVATVAAILSDYPAETIRFVTDPRTGLASNPVDPEWTGMPDPAHVKTACEIHYGPERRRLQRTRQSLKQLEEREQIDRAGRPTYEELVARCAEAGLKIGSSADITIPAAEVKSRYGITDEQWDKIPDRTAE